MVSALVLEQIVWKSRLKCGLLCKNKIVTILYYFFIPQNGTYLKNTPRIKNYGDFMQEWETGVQN